MLSTNDGCGCEDCGCCGWCGGCVCDIHFGKREREKKRIICAYNTSMNNIFSDVHALSPYIRSIQLISIGVYVYMLYKIQHKWKVCRCMHIDPHMKYTLQFIHYGLRFLLGITYRRSAPHFYASDYSFLCVCFYLRFKDT